jgi:hypothetical protein
MPWSERQSVEIFHLVFVSLLGARVDKALYAIKGGANLRFFFGSPRHSEDIDFDVRTVAAGTLRSNVERILRSPGLDRQLAVAGIRVEEWSAPKQTETTQRWKVMLSVRPASVRLHSKIEFSRRGVDDGTEFGPVSPAIVGTYGLGAVSATHYGRRAAFWQKVAALAGRTATQARDVFDLDLLLSSGADVGEAPAGAARRIGAAIENAVGITFDDFQGQVLEYLPSGVQQAYDRAVWEGLVVRVVERLEALR